MECFSGYIHDLPGTFYLGEMAWKGVTQFAKVTVADYTELRSFWKKRDRFSRMVIAQITVTKPITEAQRRRIPKDLATKLA